MSPQGLDLSGVWHGQYSDTQLRQHASFVATLVEQRGRFSGDTEETGALGEAKGHMLTATVDGRRDGVQLSFLKLYDGDFDAYDCVRYEGEVSDDGSEILGRWIVPDGPSGEFMMIRASDLPMAALRVAQTTV